MIEQLQTPGAVPMNPMAVQSAGPGGQAYVSVLFSGAILSAAKEYPLFTFAENDTAKPFARLLTNLKQPNQLGNGENFTAVQACFRAFKVQGDVPTKEEITALKSLISGLGITATWGSNETKILDIRGWMLESPENFIASDDTATSMVSSSGGNVAGWVNLAVRQPFGPSDNLGGTIRLALDVPAVLRTTGQEWAILFAYAGIKQVK